MTTHVRNSIALSALATLVCSGVLTTQASAQTQVDTLRLDASGTGMLLRDTSNDAVSSHDAEGQGVYALQLEFGDFAAGLEYTIQRVDREVFDDVDSEYTARGARARFSYMYPLLDWFRPYAGVSAGLNVATIRMSVATDDFQDRALGVTGGRRRRHDAPVGAPASHARPDQ